MANEESLIQKIYYEKILKDADEKVYPVKALGDLYFNESKKDLPELSNIRFAQGEVYFHNSDFETAIFKWENIQNELEPWAKKNMADAYFELDLLETAENLYQSIKTDSINLNTEITLQLFGLYLAMQRIEEADQMIKNAVILNPGYPNVTKLARAFFEEQQDWNSAVELAVNEATRTRSLQWFKVLNMYIEKGYTKSMKPAYFMPSLIVLAELDMDEYETIIVQFWLSYEEEGAYLSWIKEISQLILQQDFNHEYTMQRLSVLFQKTYIELMKGNYYVTTLEPVIPNMLKSWMKIAESSNAFYASASLLAWADNFPSTMEEEDIGKAEFILANTYYDKSIMLEILDIFNAIQEKANDHQLEIDQTLTWLINNIADVDTQRILLGGDSERIETGLIASIVGNNFNPSQLNAETILYRHGFDTSVQGITETGTIPVNSQLDLDEITTSPKTIIDVAISNPFFDKNKLAFVNFPHFNWKNAEQNEVPGAMRLADRLLFILNENAPFTNNERAKLLMIKEQFPEMHIDFILKLSYTSGDDQEVRNLVTETEKRIHIYFPESQLLAYSNELDQVNEWDTLAEFLLDNTKKENWQQTRTSKALFFIRQALNHLLQQQVKIEQELAETIEHEEDSLSKLQGSIHQLQDMEDDKIRIIREAYQAIKVEIQTDLAKNIPVILKKSSEIVKEDSDFRRIHLDLNEEMNKRINHYLQNNVMPIYISSLQDWIAYAQTELTISQEHLSEWENSFNTMLGEDRVRLVCDFQILNDWQRDAGRMTSTFDMEKENIILRRTPSQVLLKGAGKLFGVIPKNNAVLANAYKSFIENENYQEATESISIKFFRQFELFEKAIARDTHLFYREAFSELKQAVDDLYDEMQINQSNLEKMKSTPEVFRDPLTLIEVRIHQYEWMSHADQLKIESH
ncbi:tetratricopeptide repeat protein [Lederbergia lenta]|uniref:Tetratricopeptide (TPR) repeat family protein n=1 Tax=Lederbergia lenta TaxID=1467 RepID=A0A2X4VPF5_LEDLE|nr:hypothetical protein [Lederbergia lenta]MEC2325672.1 GTP-binding protein [Lederbergia lenta]SQI53996.1 tetratricopeptide (TPR) repeat family protein [Lederbergia lenta]